MLERAATRDWSAYRLAMEAHVPPGRLYAYRSGDATPSVETLLRLARALDARVVVVWPYEEEDDDAE
jgi:transcriptional regulator with XRE-family HTH domain